MTELPHSGSRFPDPPASIPADAHAEVQRYLQLVDEVLPALLEGLYLVGSIALDDYQAGASDVDFVAVTSQVLPGEALDAIEVVHTKLGSEYPQPEFAGFYVPRDGLRRNPLHLDDVPYVQEGRFRRTGAFEANPAVWLTLRSYPLAVRGATNPVVWHDAAILRRWTLDNLDSYWGNLVSQLRAASDTRLAARCGDMLTSCVPGVARLHYTLATEDITSKSGACRYVLERLAPRWHPVAAAALALRTGQDLSPQHPLELMHDAINFMQWVIEDAHTRLV